MESWFVSFISFGEGWHNYHHAFPWDYKAAELSTHFNQSAKFIEYFEKIGLAHDLKTASPEMVMYSFRTLFFLTDLVLLLIVRTYDVFFSGIISRLI